jgi:Cellulase (glycosyl hydrolase family 5)
VWSASSNSVIARRGLAFFFLMNRPHQILPVVVAVVAAVLAIAPASASSASHPLIIGIKGATQLFGPDETLALSRIRSAGMQTVSVPLNWPAVAPVRQPSRWDPTNPNDPNYNWSAADALIRQIVAAGLQPILQVYQAPTWARLTPDVPVSAPRLDLFAQFLHAAAERYSGDSFGLPRVRYWEIWNEPNLSLYFFPQFDFETDEFTSPDVYRAMVNAAAMSIHAVHSDNVVIAGSTAPFGDLTPNVFALDKDWGPLKFMRRFLCIDDAGRPTCDQPVSFDVWSTHPYTAGGPAHHAAQPYDVSIADLGKMRDALTAAVRAGHLKSAVAPRFWVTEFSWDSSPPDPCGPSTALLGRWIPDAFYRMWASGVDTILWFKLMDDPMATSIFQSGLYFYAPAFAGAQQKPFDEAFRFPFVALRHGNGVHVWAHTPFGKPGGVVRIQQTVNGRWTQVRKLRADRYGIVQAVLKVKPIGQFRAILGSDGTKSLPFSMRVPPDGFYNPFGQIALGVPKGKKCSNQYG